MTEFKYDQIYDIDLRGFKWRGSFIVELVEDSTPTLHNISVSVEQMYQICEEIRRFRSRGEYRLLIFKNLDSDTILSISYTKELKINEYMLSR